MKKINHYTKNICSFSWDASSVICLPWKQLLPSLCSILACSQQPFWKVPTGFNNSPLRAKGSNLHLPSRSIVTISLLYHFTTSTVFMATVNTFTFRGELGPLGPPGKSSFCGNLGAWEKLLFDWQTHKKKFINNKEIKIVSIHETNTLMKLHDLLSPCYGETSLRHDSHYRKATPPPQNYI